MESFKVTHSEIYGANCDLKGSVTHGLLQKFYKQSLSCLKKKSRFYGKLNLIKAESVVDTKNAHIWHRVFYRVTLTCSVCSWSHQNGKQSLSIIN